MTRKLDEFNNMIYQLVERSLGEMTTQSDPLSSQQVTSLEKINKIVEVLMSRERERGEFTEYRERSTEELLELLENEEEIAD